MRGRKPDFGAPLGASRSRWLELGESLCCTRKLGENRSNYENPYELVGEYRDKYRYKLVWFENWPHGLFSALLLSSAAVDESIFYQIFIVIIRSND